MLTKEAAIGMARNLAASAQKIRRGWNGEPVKHLARSENRWIKTYDRLVNQMNGWDGNAVDEVLSVLDIRRGMGHESV